MKKIIFLIVLLIFTSALFAQDAGIKMYTIHFNDKGINRDASINPSQYLSEKAVERRLNHQIAFDQSDIPVNEKYVKDISNSGARIVTRSRWFNMVVIEATPEIAERISSMPFISKVQQLGKGSSPYYAQASEKPFFENEKINPWVKPITKKAATDIYDYGAAYNQINQINGQYLHNNGYSGQGMTIAVIDAGFNSADIMTCFDSLRANNQIKGTRDFAQPGNNVYATSMHWHGTSVLSCMGAYVSGQMIGTAPKADYWLLRSEVGESESIIEEYYWVSAAEFADSIGADLINSSLGYTTFDDPTTNHTYADMDGNTAVVTNGADKAAEKGILVVNSAGNSGGGGWWYIGAPADGDSVFSIGAVDASGIRAYFSSVGPTYDRRIKPTVAAQGSEAALFFPGGLGYGSGTSFSSPITCGMTACFWQALPDLNNMQIIEAVKAAASQASEPDSLLGWGIPNYEKSYTTLSVQNQSLVKALITYPNPVINRLTIGFPVPVNGEFGIEIINIQGKVVYTKKVYEGSVSSLQINDIGDLPSGVYLLKISGNSVMFSGKIIKM
jgi:serine protease AprX